MTSSNETCPSPGKAAKIVGWILTILPSLMLLGSAGGKLSGHPEVAKGFEHMGIPISQATGLGILELGCVLIYLIPRTSVLGAILLTGYLGGAMQTHLRIGEGGIIWQHVLFGVAIWGGIFLRDPRLRKLIPLRCG